MIRSGNIKPTQHQSARQAAADRHASLATRNMHTQSQGTCSRLVNVSKNAVEAPAGLELLLRQLITFVYHTPAGGQHCSPRQRVTHPQPVLTDRPGYPGHPGPGHSHRPLPGHWLPSAGLASQQPYSTAQQQPQVQPEALRPVATGRQPDITVAAREMRCNRCS
jgi:hypothetical protein